MSTRPFAAKASSQIHIALRAALRFGLASLFLVLLGGGAQAEDLTKFARSMGLKDPAAFVETVTTLRSTGKLPAKYLTKREASGKGWRPGSDICQTIPNQLIGGDTFGNREGRLPKANYKEADLEPSCRSRGAKRLVFSGSRTIYITVDHYDTFKLVPNN